MKKRSFNYWKKRELANQLNQIKDEKVTIANMEENFNIALEDIEQQINVFHERYAKSQGISIEEALKRVSEHDVKAFEKKAKEYVKKKDFSPEANAQLKLYNATMRINRLELLKAELNLHLTDMTVKNSNLIEKHLEKLADSEYARQSGILDTKLRFSKEGVKAIVNSDYKYGNFSKNIWTNQEALMGNIATMLRRSIIQGANPTDMIGRLRSQFNVSKHEAKRLLVTEASRVQGDVQLDAIEQAGYDEYLYISEPTACDICKQLDGKHFKIKDREVGVNFYPMHPYCKCSSAAYYDSEQLDKEIAEYRKERGLDKTVESGIIESEKVLSFDNGDKIDEFFRKQKNHEKWMESLNDKEKDIITDYTMSYHEKYNKLLRLGVDRYLNSFGTTYVEDRDYYKEVYEDEHKDLLSLSNMLSQYKAEKSFKTYRRFAEHYADIPSKLEKGDTITEKGFVSTSPLKSVTDDFGHSSRDVLYEITVKKGQKVGAYISDLSDMPEEKEFLIKANTRFKVLNDEVSIAATGKELRIIKLEVEE